MSAAPQNAPELTIEDVTFDVVKKSISFDEVMKALRCIREVIGNAVTVNPNLKPLYEEYKQKAELLVKSELMKCQDIKDGQEKVTYVKNNYNLILLSKMKMFSKQSDLILNIFFLVSHTAVS